MPSIGIYRESSYLGLPREISGEIPLHTFGALQALRPLLSGHDASPPPPVARLAGGAPQATGTPLILTPATAAAVLYVSIFASLLGVAFYNRGIASVGPNVAGLFVNLVPVCTARQVWLLLGESLRSYHLAGIALIFLEIYLATFGRA